MICLASEACQPSQAVSGNGAIPTLDADPRHSRVPALVRLADLRQQRLIVLAGGPRRARCAGLEFRSRSTRASGSTTGSSPGDTPIGCRPEMLREGGHALLVLIGRREPGSRCRHSIIRPTLGGLIIECERTAYRRGQVWQPTLEFCTSLSERLDALGQPEGRRGPGGLVLADRRLDNLTRLRSQVGRDDRGPGQDPAHGDQPVACRENPV